MIYSSIQFQYIWPTWFGISFYFAYTIHYITTTLVQTSIILGLLFYFKMLISTRYVLDGLLLHVALLLRWKMCNILIPCKCSTGRLAHYQHFHVLWVRKYNYNKNATGYTLFVDVILLCIISCLIQRVFLGRHHDLQTWAVFPNCYCCHHRRGLWWYG